MNGELGSDRWTKGGLLTELRHDPKVFLSRQRIHLYDLCDVMWTREELETLVATDGVEAPEGLRGKSCGICDRL